ncbi:MAG: hypothetical protein ACLQPD_08865 [Desulfomonilaceae bacterium]
MSETAFCFWVTLVGRDPILVWLFMTSFLFWNLNRKPIQTLVSRLAGRYEVDVILLAECSITPTVLLKELNQNATASYHYVPQLGCTKIQIFTRFSRRFIRAVYETDRLTVRHLKLPGLTDVLLAVTHFISKMHWSEHDQGLECGPLAESIRKTETKVGHSRTILVGDFNMNPFEFGVVSAGGLHAVMSRWDAEREERIVQSKRYPFFYNPMWSLLGDASIGPPGTYYYNDSAHNVLFWNMFDQVLVRPALLDRFHNVDLEVLTGDGSVSFLTPRGLPDSNLASDHLPILFRLQL